MDKSCESPRTRHQTMCLARQYVFFGGVLKIRCPINRQIDILHTDPSALPLHLSLWHTRSIGNVSGRRSKAAIFGFFVLSFRIFLLLLFNNSLVYMWRDSFCTRLDFKLTCSFLFYFFIFYTDQSHKDIILRSIIYCFKLLHVLLLNGVK